MQLCVALHHCVVTFRRKKATRSPIHKQACAKLGRRRKAMFSSNMLPPGVATVTPSTAHEVVGLKQQNSDKVFAEYIWVGATGADLKSRSVVLDEYQPGCSPDDLPIAAIDGGEYTEGEIYLQPKKVYPDPFRGGNHILVLCDVYSPPLMCNTANPWDNLQPHSSNHRAGCEQVMKHASHLQPVFTMQQEYTVSCNGGYGQLDGGFHMGSAPVPIKSTAGMSDKAAARVGREVSELHMQACLAAGLSYSVSISSSMHQFAYKIGPCLGVDIADQLCVSRYLLQQAADRLGVDIHYDTLGKPGGSSITNRCSIQFSISSSRDPFNGLSSIQVMMERLSTSHLKQTALHPGCIPSGQSSDCSWHSCNGFSESGVNEAPHVGACFNVGAGKNASIMVPTSTILNGCGPILDRRPPASADPYLISMLLVSTACAVPLPQSTMSAMQLAMELQFRSAALTAADISSSKMFAESSSQQHTHSRHSLSDGSIALSATAPSSFSYGSLASFGGDSVLSGDSLLSGASVSGGSATINSQDVLLSALDRLDGFRCSHVTAPIAMSGGSMCSYADDDICSDASSPVMGNALADAAAEDEMYLE